MVHTHNMAEDMLNFQIDTTTRKLVNVSGRKGFLVQGDHDSKIVVFEMPRVVEGHDMAECNEVRVHYINISKNRKRKKEGVYEVLDKTVSESGESIQFSWKISGNATEICGTLYFLIQFSCVPDDIDYVWNTEICKEIRVSEGINNSDVVVEEYADILEQWKQRLFGNEDCLEERLTEISGRIADNSKGIKENKEDIAQKADKANPTFTGSMSMNRKDGTKIGDKSTALGENNEASGVWSFVTGVGNVATHMKSSVVSGENNVVKSNNGIASGFNNGVFGHCSCAEGNGNQIGTEDAPDSRDKAMCCHAEGKDNIIDKHSFIHVQGLGNIGKGSCSDVSGKYNIPDEDSKYAKIVGNGASDKNRSNAHTLDWKGNGWFAGKLSQEGTPSSDNDLTTKKYVDTGLSDKADKNHAEITGSLSMGRLKGSAIGSNSATFGTNNVATSGNSFASGYGSNATGNVSFAGNAHTTASGYASFAIGENTLASSSKSYAEGHYTTSSGTASHAEGYSSIASNTGSHAEGFQTNATGGASHTEGANTIASGDSSHAEGQFNSAIGNYSHAEGLHNYAYSDSGHVQGRYASHDTLEQYAHIIGNGTNNEHRSNIHTVDWNGNGWYKGRLSQDGIPTSEKDLTPKKYVDDKLSEALECIMQVNDRLYEGRDLTQVHAKEIADFTDEWNWIKERIQARNYTGIHVGDYIPMYADGNTYNMQIAGIDTYYNMVSTNIGHHIDFISKELYHRPIAWNTTANNNGSAGKNSPYLASYIYERLGQLANSSSFLPQAVRNVIVEKKTFIERRYSANGLLTESTTQSIQNIGKLWLPSEYEVFGSVVRGTPNWSQGLAVQYPLFANSGSNRNKKIVNTENIAAWWTNTVSCGDAENVCSVGRNASINSASNYTIYVPICFRIDDSN